MLKYFVKIGILLFITVTASLFAPSGTRAIVGDSWDRVAGNADWGARAFHQSVVFKNKMWVIGGSTGGFAPEKNDVYSSPDGIKWSLETSNAEWEARTNHQVVVFKNKMWLIGGTNKSGIRRKDIWYSEDGRKWIQVSFNPGFKEIAEHQVVVFKNKMWLIGGFGNGGFRNDVWSSEDGINWTKETSSAGWDPRSFHQVVVFKDKLWLLGGEIDKGVYKNDVWSSEDGINWTKETSSAGWDPRSLHRAVSFDNKIWVIGGKKGDAPYTSLSDVWYSEDGKEWKEAVTVAEFGGRFAHQLLLFNGRMWIIGGKNSDSYKSDVWKSGQVVFICPANKGNCDEDPNTGPSGCETDLLTDSDNCGHCEIKCNGVCQDGECKSTTGGLVPCARISDNCDTLWDERADCNVCHSVILANNIVGFLINLSAMIAFLSLVVGGFIYVVSSGSSSLLANAKNGIKKALQGFIIIFVAWIVINVIMIMFGYDDPLGDGQWHILNCEIPMNNCVADSCNNGKVESGEECERNETHEDYCERIKGHIGIACTASELSETMSAWIEMKGKCGYGCKFKCVGDDLESEIGKGCYGPTDSYGGDECQKGKYVCDPDSNSVQCVNVFGNPLYSWDISSYIKEGEKIYDYCCKGNPTEEQKTEVSSFAIKVVPKRIVPGCTVSGVSGGPSYTDAIGTKENVQAYIDANLDPNVYAPVKLHDGNYYIGCKAQTCDEACKEIGKICVGVGEYNDFNCIFSVHDDTNSGYCGGVSCKWNANGAFGDCRASQAVMPYGTSACIDEGEYFAKGGKCPPFVTLTEIWIGSTWCYCK